MPGLHPIRASAAAPPQMALRSTSFTSFARSSFVHVPGSIPGMFVQAPEKSSQTYSFTFRAAVNA